MTVARINRLRPTTTLLFTRVPDNLLVFLDSPANRLVPCLCSVIAQGYKKKKRCVLSLLESHRSSLMYLDWTKMSVVETMVHAPKKSVAFGQEG